MPKDVNDAYRLDKENDNNLWAEAIDKEMSALHEMDCFTFHEKGTSHKTMKVINGLASI